MIFTANIAQKDNGIEGIISIEAKDKSEAEQIVSASGLYYSSIDENLSFKMNPDTFGKAITTDALPEKLFVAGKKEKEDNFTLVLHLDNHNSYALAWQNANDLENWMKHQDIRFPYFDVDTNKLFFALHNSKIKYLLFNHEKDKIGQTTGKIDLCDFKSVESVYLNSIDSELQGIFSECASKIIAKYPSLRPLEILNRTTALITNFFTKLPNDSVHNFRASGDFDIIWSLLWMVYKKQEGDLTKDVQDVKNTASIKAFADDGISVSVTAFNECKHNYEFSSDQINLEVDSALVYGLSDEAIKTILKEYLEKGLYNDLNLKEAIEKLIATCGIAIRIEVLTVLTPIIEKGFSPRLPCSKCSETNFILISISPNKAAAIWECSYCHKQTIVKTNSTDDSTTGNDRAISKDVQREVWRRDNGKCAVCGSSEKLEFDHIVPVSKGGSNTARNIQLRCEKCNRQKGNNIGG